MTKLQQMKPLLVCMLTGIRGNWKIPIAYFLVKGTKAGIQSGIIRECLLASFDVGINVLNVTMDGTSHNITALEKLGAKIFVPRRFQIVSSFPHPSDKAHNEVSVYMDPPHMLKLIRNTLADYQKIFWPGRGWVK